VPGTWPPSIGVRGRGSAAAGEDRSPLDGLGIHDAQLQEQPDNHSSTIRRMKVDDAIRGSLVISEIYPFGDYAICKTPVM
jgi:hypothetical protein